VFMIFELTQDYQILVPLMVANLLSFMISKHFQPKPIYHALLEQDGIFLPGPESRLRPGFTSVRDVMTPDVLLVLPETSIEAVRDLLNQDGNRPLIVGSKDLFTGTLATPEIEKAIKAGRGHQPISSLDVQTNCPHVYLDQPLDVVLEKLAQTSGVIPVLSRHGHQFLGAVTKDTVMRFLDRNPAEKT
ncbi:MAG TPA: CBS domain-containing protein, partial [Candidatus Angelobacter sp.]